MPEAFQQRNQIIEAPVYVADDVEWAGFALPVGPRRRPLDGGRVHLFGGVEHVHVAEALPFEATYGTLQLLHLLAHYVGTGLPVSACAVAILAIRLRYVQHDCRRQAIVTCGQLD